MKKKLIAAAQLVSLGGTAWLLIATSPAPRECVADGPVTYTIVKNTCGATGEVQIANDQSCDVAIPDGKAFGLPTTGSVSMDKSTFRVAGATLFRDATPAEGPSADAGPEADAGDADAGDADAGEADAGEADAGEADAGEADAGSTADAGGLQTGDPDGGAADAGDTSDAGTAPLYDTCTLTPSAADAKTLLVTCTSAGVPTCEAELTEK